METFERLQVHYYWWFSPSIINHNGYCRIWFVFLFPSAWFFSPACFMELFFLDTTLFSACFFLLPWWLPPPVSCRLTDQAAFVMSVTASPSHHQCLTLTLALIFSQLPHPECWMPRLPLEASPPPRLLLACFACLVPGAGLGLVSMWWCCLCPDALVLYFFCIPAASCSRGATLWSFSSCCRITTVPVLLSFSLLSWLKLSWYSAHRLILEGR